MTRKLSSKGFAPVFIIGALLIAVTLGAGCYFVWQHSKKNDKSSKATTSASQSTQSRSDGSTSQTADPSDGGKYLYIKEWGVRFALPEDLRGDISYRQATSSIGLDGVLFASKKLDTLVGDGSCSIQANSDGATGPGLNAKLGRIDPGHPGQVTMDYYRSQYTYVAAVSNYEYYYANNTKNPPVTCTSENHSDQNGTEEHISDELKTAFKTIEAVKN